MDSCRTRAALIAAAIAAALALVLLAASAPAAQSPAAGRVTAAKHRKKKCKRGYKRVGHRCKKKKKKKHHHSVDWTPFGGGGSSSSGGGSSGGGSGGGGSDVEPDHGLIPNTPTLYQGEIAGTTYQWNGWSSSYEPTANFDRGISFVVDPHPWDSSSRAFGFFAGTPSIGDGAGSIHFGTNSVVYQHLQGYSIPANAVIDVAATQVDSANGTAAAQVDSGWARTVQVNLFNLDGVSAAVQVLDGEVKLEFTNGGAEVTGTLELYGNKLIEPGNTFPVDAYAASFSATQTSWSAKRRIHPPG